MVRNLLFSRKCSPYPKLSSENRLSSVLEFSSEKRSLSLLSLRSVVYSYLMDIIAVWLIAVAYLGNLFGGGVQQIQLRKEDRENGDLGGGSPLVRGSGGSCNLVQEISFHIVKYS